MVTLLLLQNVVEVRTWWCSVLCVLSLEAQGMCVVEAPSNATKVPVLCVPSREVPSSRPRGNQQARLTFITEKYATEAVNTPSLQEIFLHNLSLHPYKTRGGEKRKEERRWRSRDMYEQGIARCAGSTTRVASTTSSPTSSRRPRASRRPGGLGFWLVAVLVGSSCGSVRGQQEDYDYGGYAQQQAPMRAG